MSKIQLKDAKVDQTINFDGYMIARVQVTISSSLDTSSDKVTCTIKSCKMSVSPPTATSPQGFVNITGVGWNLPYVYQQFPLSQRYLKDLNSSYTQCKQAYKNGAGINLDSKLIGYVATSDDGGVAVNYSLDNSSKQKSRTYTVTSLNSSFEVISIFTRYIADNHLPTVGRFFQQRITLKDLGLDKYYPFALCKSSSGPTWKSCNRSKSGDSGYAQIYKSTGWRDIKNNPFDSTESANKAFYKTSTNKFDSRIALTGDQ